MRKAWLMILFLSACSVKPISNSKGIVAENAGSPGMYILRATVPAATHALDQSAMLIRSGGEVCRSNGFPFFDLSRRQTAMIDAETRSIEARVFCYQSSNPSGILLPTEERELPERAQMLGPSDLERYQTLLQ